MNCSKCNLHDSDYLYTKDNKPLCARCINQYLFDREKEERKVRLEKQKKCEHDFSYYGYLEDSCDKCGVIQCK